MNTFSTIITSSKKITIAGSLLLALAVSPAVSASNYDHKDKHRGQNAEKSIKHHRSERSDYRHKHSNHERREYRMHKNHEYRGHRYSRKHKRHGHDHHYDRPKRYVVRDYGHHHDYFDRLGFQIGLHTGNFDIVFRD